MSAIRDGSVERREGSYFFALFLAPDAQSASWAAACLEDSAWALSAATAAFFALPAAFLVFSVFLPPIVAGMEVDRMGRGRSERWWVVVVRLRLVILDGRGGCVRGEVLEAG